MFNKNQNSNGKKVIRDIIAPRYSSFSPPLNTPPTLTSPSSPQKQSLPDRKILQKRKRSTLFFLNKNILSKFGEGIIAIFSKLFSFFKLGASIGKGRIKILFLTVFLIIFLIFVIDSFSFIILRITPHQKSLSVNTILNSSGGTADDLPIEIISFSLTEEIVGQTSGTEKVKEKSSGRIIIYNAYSSEPQVLIKRTRFETSDNKIYRTDRSITVPGAEVKNGEIIPRSIEVEVFADQPGEEYNIGLTDFTIPGFKGTARYAKFYARSKTPMEGGFNGIKKVIAEQDLKDLKFILVNRLEEKIMSEYKKQIFEDFIMPDGAFEISYGEAIVEPLSDTADEGDSANSFDLNKTTSNTNINEIKVRLSGNFKGILLKKDDISRALALTYLNEKEQGVVRVMNLEDLNIKILNFNFDKPEISTQINGEARIIWILDEEELRNDFLTKKKSITKIFDSYEFIDKAEIVFKPSFWRFMPNNGDKIRIEQILLK